MKTKKIKLTVDSRLDSLSLIGAAINNLCSLSPLSEVECSEIELCAVEAVTNSIEHAYEKDPGHEIEILFKLSLNSLTIEVCDWGKPMKQDIFREKDLSSLKIDPHDLDSIPVDGRGIAIIKEIMDEVAYRTEGDKNCLVMTKKISHLHP